MLPIDVDVLPQAAKEILADRMERGGLEKQRPECLKLFVRDVGEGWIGKRSPANPRRFVRVSRLHVALVKIEEVEIGIFVQLVLDVLIHNFVEKPLRWLLVSEGVKKSGTCELAGSVVWSEMVT